MRVLVVSDTHRHNENLYKVLDLVAPIDMLIHCGDVEGSGGEIEDVAGCCVAMVAGNNDFFSDLPAEREFDLGKYHVWMTHGHTYHVNMGHEWLRQEAVKKHHADLIFFGHTHRPVIDRSGEAIVINPGSLSYPRQEGRRPSYVLMTIAKDGTADFELCYL